MLIDLYGEANLMVDYVVVLLNISLFFSSFSFGVRIIYCKQITTSKRF